jgi:two-component system, OmpR family, phosphate regulon sensor histidine kinase PhoR
VQGRVNKGDGGQVQRLSVRTVIRSKFLWKIYGAIAVTVFAALVTVAAVFASRSPVMGGADALELLSSLCVATVAGLTVALGVGFLVARGVQKSLSEITRIAQSLTDGNFSARVKKISDDEFGLLGLTLNLLGEGISDRMATLSQERTQLAALFGEMVEGIVAIGDDDRILFANRAADRLMRTAVSLSLGKQISDVPGLGVLMPVVIQCRTEKKRKHTELTLGDGEILSSLDTHASPFKGEQTAGVVVVLNDITELRRLERVRRDFVANVSHELKTPLTSIKGYVETLQSGAKSDPAVLNRFLERIDVNASRLVELVQDILSLAKIENQDGKLGRTAVDLTAIAKQSMIHHEHALMRKNIRLSIDLAENVIVQGDREALRQVLDNLLTNAIKYTADGGEVRLSLAREGQNAILKLKDNGVGIPLEHQARVFERFYRVDKHRSREDGGTGLGLSIVKHLVHSMNGKVALASEPGCGSTFTVQMHLQG